MQANPDTTPPMKRPRSPYCSGGDVKAATCTRLVHRLLVTVPQASLIMEMLGPKHAPAFALALKHGDVAKKTMAAMRTFTTTNNRGGDALADMAVDVKHGITRLIFRTTIMPGYEEDDGDRHLTLLERLAPTLTHLTLFRDHPTDTRVVELLRRMTKLHALTFEGMTAAYRSGHCDRGRYDQSFTLDHGKLPPSLRELTLPDDSKVSIVSLPQSLRSLRMGTVASVTDAKALPPLTTVSLIGDPSLLLASSRVCKGLVSLETRCQERLQVHQLENLRTLHIPAQALRRRSSETGSVLPVSLHTLSAGHESDSDTEREPEDRLTLNCGDSQLRVLTLFTWNLFVQCLPQSLVELHLAEAWMIHRIPEVLPAGLRHIYVGEGSNRVDLFALSKRRASPQQ
jgi:hypothetical protein